MFPLQHQPRLQGDSARLLTFCLSPGEVPGCQGLHQQLLPLFLPSPPRAALYLLSAGLKVHSARCNYAVSAVLPRVKHSPSLRSLVCCSLEVIVSLSALC